MKKFVQDAIDNEDFEVLKRCRDTLNGTLFASKFISSLSLGEMVKSKSIPRQIEVEAFMPSSAGARGFWAIRYFDLIGILLMIVHCVFAIEICDLFGKFVVCDDLL